MTRHHDRSAPAGARGLEVLEPLDAHAAAQAAMGPPPGAGEFEHADAQCREVLAQQALARRRVELGKHNTRLRAAISRRVRRAIRSSAPRHTRARAASGLATSRAPRARRCPATSAVARGEWRRGGIVRWHASILPVARPGIGRRRCAARLRYAVAMQADPIERAVERVLRGLYSAALYMLVPVTVYHLIWRGFRQREYLLRWNERYAIYAQASHDSTVWVHAVSVGEVNAAAPLVNALRAARPDLRLLLTTITPTARRGVRECGAMRSSMSTCPTTCLARGALPRALPPAPGADPGTELWPNLLLGVPRPRRAGLIVNARLSERSRRGYRVLKPLVWRALRTLRGVLAQSPADGERFIKLGATRAIVTMTGNLIYDIASEDGRRSRSSSTRAAAGGGHGSRPAPTSRKKRRSSHPSSLRGRCLICCCCGRRAPRALQNGDAAGGRCGWRVSTRRLTHGPTAMMRCS